MRCQCLHRGKVVRLCPSGAAASVSESLAPGLNLPTEPNQCGARCLVLYHTGEAHCPGRSLLVPVDYNWNEDEAKWSLISTFRLKRGIEGCPLAHAESQT